MNVKQLNHSAHREKDLENTLKMLHTAITHNAAHKLEMIDELWYAYEIAGYVNQGYTWDEAGSKFLSTP